MRQSPILSTITIGLLAFVLGAAACGEDAIIAALPVADAGFDKSVPPGSEVTLDGSQSHDPDDAELAFKWKLESVPDGSLADLLAPTTASPRFTPDEPGDYIVSLKVDNGRRWSQPDIVAIHAVNNAVVADAQCVGACEVFHGTAGSVSGRGSYGGTGASFTYTWTQITSAAACATACPEMSACDPITDAVTWTEESAEIGLFIAPCALSMLVFELSVTDGNTTNTDCISVASLNRAPVARISMSGVNTGTAPPSVDELASFSLSGANSTDADSICDTTLFYTWTQTSPAPLAATDAVIDAADSFFTNVTVPDIGATTIYDFQLVVSDGADASESPCTTFGSGGDCGARIQVLNL